MEGQMGGWTDGQSTDHLIVSVGVVADGGVLDGAPLPRVRLEPRFVGEARARLLVTQPRVRVLRTLHNCGNE